MYTVLMGNVKEALIRNVNAYRPSAAQQASLDSILACVRRSAMQGTAHTLQSALHRSTASLEVLRHWSVPPCVVELRVRRIDVLAKGGLGARGASAMDCASFGRVCKRATRCQWREGLPRWCSGGLWTTSSTSGRRGVAGLRNANGAAVLVCRT